MPRRRSEDDYYEDAHDERVDPHADLVPDGMGDPEWSRYLVNTKNNNKPVGDPTVWGGNVLTQIDSDPVLGATPRLVAGGQIILAQGQDKYARSWSLNGVLWLPFSVWGTASPTPTPPGFPEILPDATSPALAVWLSVRMGVERNVQEHQILLAAGDQAQNFGLCWNQYVGNGGPYGAQVPQPTPANALMGLPFSCIGAFVGNTLAIQALYARGIGATCNEVRITAMVTPYQPGAGI